MILKGWQKYRHLWIDSNVFFLLEFRAKLEAYLWQLAWLIRYPILYKIIFGSSFKNKIESYDVKWFYCLKKSLSRCNNWQHTSKYS